MLLLVYLCPRRTLLAILRWAGSVVWRCERLEKYMVTWLCAKRILLTPCPVSHAFCPLPLVLLTVLGLDQALEGVVDLAAHAHGLGEGRGAA